MTIPLLVDLRSDTLSKPSHAMRTVMAEAPVGDSFYDEDPSVNILESSVAKLFGHEAALFVPSGTMSNQIAIQLHCDRGDSLMCAADLHILRAESGGVAALAGVQPCVLPVHNEFIPDLEKLDELYVPKGSPVSAPTGLVVAENTHLFSGGRIHPLSHLQNLSAWCAEKSIPLHIDGARIWHAHVETGVPLNVYGRLCTSLSVCFSKGLGAPAGSCLTGSHSFINRAKILRKRLGGTMRQCGILAAAATYAMNHHLAGLKDDHRNASKLAEWLGRKFPDAEIPKPETNIVIMKFKQNSLGILKELEHSHNLRLSALNPKTLRAVCYRDVTAAMIDEAVNYSSTP
ncbi:MAG: aminotransferase class I/II-fold pyridoxal phosphate-dependent enzyme [Proteobacteria bacterium]|nr:aminotransferase class I/II-fold pyridoxal phosphate-dependent enzyme [Pseudomonadota bacterium]